MHRVRYYTRLVEPQYFLGLRGWWIRVLNRVRFAVEARVCRHVARYLAAEDGLAPKDVKDVMAAFRKDLNEERDLFDVELHGSSSVLDSTGKQPGPSQTVGRRMGRVDDMVARMIAPARSKRYTAGSAHKYLDPEGDFDTVEPTENEPDIEVSYARGQSPSKHQAPSREIRRTAG